MTDCKWSEQKKKHFESKAKISNQDERLQKWKDDFKNSRGNPPEIMDKPSKEIINDQLVTKLGYFTEEELDVIL